MKKKKLPSPKDGKKKENNQNNSEYHGQSKRLILAEGWLFPAHTTICRVAVKKE